MHRDINTVRMLRVSSQHKLRHVMVNTKTANAVRIIAGDLRSRRIEFPEAAGLRPTGDRIRETLFNWLRNDIEQSRCLDLFAGSGVLGFEAASRGASRVQFIELNPNVVSSLQASAESLQLTNVQVQQADSLAWLHQAVGGEAQFDIVFVDPPFSEGLLMKSCDALADSDLLADHAWVYLESATPAEIDRLPQSWSVSKSKKAGAVYYYLVQTF